MATTTPNYGWVVPTSTDLVKDGATAIETLGDSIDASFVGLKGGTTGQVLSKTSGTDLAFTWIAQDDSNAIQNSIVDAKGDLIAATANDTPARLAVGTNGHVLTADSTAATGLKWAAAAAGGKVLQMVTATYATETTIASTTYADIGLTATITPTSATSKILVMTSIPLRFYRSAPTGGSKLKLIRGATDIWIADPYSKFDGNNQGVTEVIATNTLIYVDSPSTTSATTYKVQGAAQVSTSSGTTNWQTGGQTSTMTLLEIGA